jgi:hypothetical protein
MVEVDISIVFAGLSIAASILYYASVLQNANKTQQMQAETRQAQLFMNIYNTFASKEYQRDREQMMVVWDWDGFDDFFAKYGPVVNPDDHAVFDMTLQWMEGIGVLVRRGLIDPELVYDLMYLSIINFWEKHEIIIQGIREQGRLANMKGASQVWVDLEYIYNVMKSIEGVRHPNSQHHL